jgi:hypothetical protein
MNDNNGNGNVTKAQVGGVSWAGRSNVVSLVLMSWQPVAPTVTWPAGYAGQASANDGYSFVSVAAGLAPQLSTSLPGQTVTLSAAEAVIPTLQVAVAVGP